MLVGVDDEIAITNTETSERLELHRSAYLIISSDFEVDIDGSPTSFEPPDERWALEGLPDNFDEIIPDGASIEVSIEWVGGFGFYGKGTVSKEDVGGHMGVRMGSSD